MADKDPAVMHLEDQACPGMSADDAEFLANFTDEAKKKVLRKVRSEGIQRSIEDLLTVCV